MSSHDLWAISPALAMAAVAGLVLTFDLVLQEKRYLPWIALVAMIAPVGFALLLWFDWMKQPEINQGFFGAVVADRFSLFFQLLIIGVSSSLLLASTRFLERKMVFRGEFITLILLAASGMMLLTSARELITIFVALELASLPMVALVAMQSDKRSAEAGLKMFVIGAVSSAVLVYGMVFLYGYTGTTYLEGIVDRIGELGVVSDQPFGSYAILFAIVMITAGFGFKIAVVPFQMWVPDVYEGSPTPVVAFLSVASKAAGFAVLLRVLYLAFGTEHLQQEWSVLFAVMAAASMTVGNLFALSQRNFKRLLGYSTIAHAGYVLMGVASVAANNESGTGGSGQHAVLFYLGGYALTNLVVFFGLIGITNRTGNDLVEGLAGMGRRTPVLAALMAFGLISLLGLPPTVGFMGKIFVFSAAVNSGLVWLAVVGAVNTAISAFYYLNVIRVMYLDEPTSMKTIAVERPLMTITVLGTVGIALFGIGPWLLLEFASQTIG